MSIAKSTDNVVYFDADLSIKDSELVIKLATLNTTGMTHIGVKVDGKVMENVLSVASTGVLGTRTTWWTQVKREVGILPPKEAGVSAGSSKVTAQNCEVDVATGIAEITITIVGEKHLVTVNFDTSVLSLPFSLRKAASIAVITEPVQYVKKALESMDSPKWTLGNMNSSKLSQAEAKTEILVRMATAGQFKDMEKLLSAEPKPVEGDMATEFINQWLVEKPEPPVTVPPTVPAADVPAKK